MLEMIINLEGDGILEYLDPKDKRKVVKLTSPITVTTLPRGMQSGAPSVAFIFELPDGKKVVAHTSAKLFLLAASAVMERYKDELVIWWRRPKDVVSTDPTVIYTKEK